MAPLPVTTVTMQVIVIIAGLSPAKAPLKEKLAGVSLPVAAVRSTARALQNGWTSSQPAHGTGSPGYAVWAPAPTDRLGLVGSRPVARARAFTSLDAIAYPQNSQLALRLDFP